MIVAKKDEKMHLVRSDKGPTVPYCGNGGMVIPYSLSKARKELMKTRVADLCYECLENYMSRTKGAQEPNGREQKDSGTADSRDKHKRGKAK